MIKANFSAYSKYVTDSLNQWDLNQVLQVAGLNLTTAPEVHFSNANNDRAIVRQATMENHVVRVGIPNSLLQDPLRIYAHIGIYEGDTFKVVELVEIPVNPRKRPLDYQIEVNDEEVYSFKRLENMLSNAATKDQVANIVSGVGSDAELVDVRTDIDNTVHASAGEAVRAKQRSVKWINSGDLNGYFSGQHTIMCVSGGNVANTPEADNGIVLVDSVKLYTGKHWCRQTWVNVNGYNTNTFVRSGKNDGTEWSRWRKVNMIDKEPYTYIGSGDLNDYAEESFYGIVSAAVANVPEKSDGMLDCQVYKTGIDAPTTQTVQTWYGYQTGNVYYRHHIPYTGWGEWYKISGGGAHPLAGKKVVFLGDSVYGNDDSATGIVQRFAAKTGANCYNFAFGGTRAKTRSGGDEWSKFDGESLVTAIVSGDYSEQKAALTTIETSLVGQFTERLAAMEKFDWSDVDYVVCDWGTNDWFGGVSMDDYKAAMTGIIGTILTKYNNIVFVKCTPIMRFLENGEDNWVSGTDWTQATTGASLKDFVSADKETGDALAVPVIDCYNIGINAYTRTHFFTEPDCTHPNATGNERIATYLAGQIN